jgi:hypothetical protein
MNAAYCGSSTSLCVYFIYCYDFVKRRTSLRIGYLSLLILQYLCIEKSLLSERSLRLGLLLRCVYV